METENVIFTELYTLYYRNKMTATWLIKLITSTQNNEGTTTQRKNKTGKKKTDLCLQTENGSYALHVVLMSTMHTHINVHVRATFIYL